jgi:c-di-AMP phosphodiesterase-like protein
MKFFKLHFISLVCCAVINTLIVLSDNKQAKMLMLVSVLVLQHMTIIFIIVGYEQIYRAQWKQKETRLKKELNKQKDI